MAEQDTYVLLQHGVDPFRYSFEDVDGRVAFTVEMVTRDPNLIVKLSRQDQWALRHPDIMGPRNSYLYFGPNNSPGHLAYGGSEPYSMANYLHQRRENRPTRYFLTQNGRELKWKTPMPRRMECSDLRSVIAVWEMVDPSVGYNAQLTLTHTGLLFATEIITSLTLYHMARQLYWW